MLTAFSVIRFWLPCLSGYQKRQMSSKSRKFLWLRRMPKKQIGLTIRNAVHHSINVHTHIPCRATMTLTRGWPSGLRSNWALKRCTVIPEPLWKYSCQNWLVIRRSVAFRSGCSPVLGHSIEFPPVMMWISSRGMDFTSSYQVYTIREYGLHFCLNHLMTGDWNSVRLHFGEDR